MLSVSYKPFILSVIVLSVVMLSVVLLSVVMAPFRMESNSIQCVFHFPRQDTMLPHLLTACDY
jgi:hypothetical protein